MVLVVVMVPTLPTGTGVRGIVPFASGTRLCASVLSTVAHRHRVAAVPIFVRMDLAVALPAGAAARPLPPSRSRYATSLAADVLPLCDFGCLAAAAWVSTTLCALWLAPQVQPDVPDTTSQGALTAAVLAAFMFYNKQFGSSAARGATRALLHAHGLRFALFVGIVLLLAFSRPIGHSAAPMWLTVWLTLGVLSTSLTRLLLARYVQHLELHGVFTEVVAVVGAGPVADRLVQRLRREHSATIELLGIFDDNPPGASSGAVKPCGTLAQLIEVGKSRHIDWIVLTLPATAHQRLYSLLQRLKVLAVPIGLCSQHVGAAWLDHPIDFVSHCVPVTLLADRPIKQWDAVAKSAEDLLLGGLVTLLLLPLLALIAVAIKLDSPGPVLYKQRRHAFNNTTFEIYKFRTMRWDPASSDLLEFRQTSRNDERVTALGRFLRVSSLDELPQLFNVLRGEMSLVGPRPLAVNMRTENRLGIEITDAYEHRHRVKPGITGWSQVMGSRGATQTTADLRRRVELDLHYIEHWSLLLDLRILALTSFEVVKATNAY
jgi:Undecaprenyl-phosphate glucose phosphotransferase